jgi:hypothetical protein
MDRVKRLWAIPQQGGYRPKFAEVYGAASPFARLGQAVGRSLTELGTLKGIAGRSENSVIFSTSANL